MTTQKEAEIESVKLQNTSFSNLTSNVSSVYEKSEFTETEVFSVTCVLVESPSIPLANRKPLTRSSRKSSLSDWLQTIIT